MAVVAKSALEDSNPAVRLDAEFFNRAALKAISKIRSGEYATLGELTERIQHPAEVVREYQEDADEGLPTLMAACIRNNRLDLSNVRMMDVSAAEAFAPNLLNDGDLVMTRSGAGFGTVASWNREDQVMYACADLLVARNPNAPSGYLSTYLSSKFGEPLCIRSGYGSAQPHISPAYVSLLPVPRFAELEGKIDSLVRGAGFAELRASEAQQTAEATLIEALGLGGWSPPEPLTYTRSAAAVRAAGRYDAEFAAPAVQALIARLAQSGETVGSLASPRRDKFKPTSSGDFNYIEISDIGADGRCGASSIAMSEAPSRATWTVHAGDVITSTVRPNRRLSAIIAPDQNGHIGTSGLLVLKPERISPEALMTYLRLPIICDLMGLYTTSSMYPAIADRDILALPCPDIANDVEKAIIAAVQASADHIRQSESLLATAKRAVEIAIEDSEGAACAFLEAGRLAQ